MHNKAIQIRNEATLVSDREAGLIIEVGNFITPIVNLDAQCSNSDTHRSNSDA